MRAHPILRVVLARIEAVEKTAIGQPYTDLAPVRRRRCRYPAVIRCGKGELGSARLLGDLVLPLLPRNPPPARGYAAYKAKGLEIYCVSLDNDEAKWRSFTSDNDMPWINVLGIDADKQSTAAAAYGITSTPRTS